MIHLPADLASRLLTAAIVIDVVLMVDWVTRTLFTQLAAITPEVAAAYGALLAMPAVYIAFYEWARRRGHEPD